MTEVGAGVTEWGRGWWIASGQAADDVAEHGEDAVDAGEADHPGDDVFAVGSFSAAFFGGAALGVVVGGHGGRVGGLGRPLHRHTRACRGYLAECGADAPNRLRPSSRPSFRRPKLDLGAKPNAVRSAGGEQPTTDVCRAVRDAVPLATAVWAPNQVWGDGSWGRGDGVRWGLGAVLGEIPAAEHGYDGGGGGE